MYLRYSSVNGKRSTRVKKNVIRKYDYVCGCLITPDGSMLSGSVFTRLEMHCKTPVEWVYYGAAKITAQKDLCCHCSKQGAQQTLFKTVLPICDGCRAEGEKVYKQGLLKQLLPTKKEKKIHKDIFSQFNIHYFYATLLLCVYYSLEPALIIL